MPAVLNRLHIDLTHAVVRVSTGKVYYPASSKGWTEHMEHWREQLNAGNSDAPSPMPEGHCMFAKPVQYGSVPLLCRDRRIIRQALMVERFSECDDREKRETGYTYGRKGLRKTPRGRQWLAESLRAIRVHAIAFSAREIPGE